MSVSVSLKRSNASWKRMGTERLRSSRRGGQSEEPAVVQKGGTLGRGGGGGGGGGQQALLRGAATLRSLLRSGFPAQRHTVFKLFQ